MRILPTKAPMEQRPIEITITEAGRQSLVLRVLTRQAIPMLERPEHYPLHERRQLAQTLTAALELDDPCEERVPVHTDADAPPEENLGYEPGCCIGCCGTCGGCIQ